MDSSEKFYIKWNDFRNCVSSSFKNMHQDTDFTDVTLIGEDNKRILAHKFVLASSSPIFSNILKENQHPNPLIYLRGIKDIHLSAIIEFMYQGEVNISQNDIEAFLSLAEEFQLKGLIGEGEEMQKQPQVPKVNKMLPEITSVMRIERENSKSNLWEDIEEIRENYFYSSNKRHEVVAVSSQNMATHKEQIMSMMGKIDLGWICKVCGKSDTSRNKTHLMEHIEAHHMGDISLPCNICGAIQKSTAAVRAHIRKDHYKEKQ